MYGFIKYDANKYPRSIYGRIRTYVDIYLYMNRYGHIWTTYMDTYQPLAAGRGGLRRVGDLRKLTPLDVFNMYSVNFVDVHGFEASLDIFSKVGNLFK